MPGDDRKRAAHRALVDRILHGEGRTSAEQRARAFDNAEMAPPLHALIDKVATRPTQVTDADFRCGQGSGLQRGPAVRAGDVGRGRSVRPAVRGGTGGARRGNRQRRRPIMRPGILEHGYRRGTRLLFVLTAEDFGAGARYLLKRGYR